MLLSQRLSKNAHKRLFEGNRVGQIKVMVDVVDAEYPSRAMHGGELQPIKPADALYLQLISLSERDGNLAGVFWSVRCFLLQVAVLQLLLGFSTSSSVSGV